MSCRFRDGHHAGAARWDDELPAGHDLAGISLEGNNLTGANLAGQNLTAPT